MSFVSKIANAYPSVRRLATRMDSPHLQNIEALRSDIAFGRAEFWLRRTQNIPAAIRAARAQSVELFTTKLSNPASWTYGDAASLGVVGVQLFGCFCVGEVVARRSLTGYNIGNEHH